MTAPDAQPLLNYSTTVPVERTLSEVQAMLGRAGAARVSVEYLTGIPSAIAFALDTRHGVRFYTLPVDRAAVYAVLGQQQSDDPARFKAAKVTVSQAQADRVAWRVIKDWLEAQLALVRTQMVDLDQVMLPYLQIGDGLTLYAAWRDSEARALPSGSS